MNRTLWLISGLGFGAGLMYILDPERGEQRRTATRNQLASYGHQTDEFFGHATRSLGRQARGLFDSARQPFQSYTRQVSLPTLHRESSWLMTGLRILGYVGLGMGAMYVLDPRDGRRRRALVRDKTKSYWNRTGRSIQKTTRDIGNRTRALGRKASQQLRHSPVPEDAVLVARVLAQIGHVMTHPGTLDVTAQEGRVTLSGTVPEHERERLLTTVASVAGVSEVVNRLQAQHASEPAAGARSSQTTR